MRSRINLAVVGVGRMGLIRLNCARSNPLFNVSHVVDAFNPELATQHAELHDAKFVKTIDEALEDNSLDAVWIAVGTGAHKEIITKCLKKGIPVATEKPVCETPNDISECFNLSEQKQLPLFCSFQRRFDDAYVGVAKKVQEGFLGQLHSGVVTFRDHPVPKKEFLIHCGGVFVDLAVHDIDYIRYATGEDPNYIWGRSFTFDPFLRQHGAKEAAKFTMTFPSELSVSFDISRISPSGYDNRCEFAGENGCLQVNNPHRSSMTSLTADGISNDVWIHSFPERYTMAFQNEVDHFAEILDKKIQPKVSRVDCLRSLQIALAAQHSDEVGRGVHLEFSGDEMKIVDPYA